MKQDRNVALARLGEELKRPPFHAVLRPRPVDIDPDSGTVSVALDYRDDLARAPDDNSFHGGVNCGLRYIRRLMEN
jgi:acyl-coenzyme A thioesterase PaaI-like protein